MRVCPVSVTTKPSSLGRSLLYSATSAMVVITSGMARYALSWACTGTSTRPAAYRALLVSRESEGGQSMSTMS